MPVKPRRVQPDTARAAKIQAARALMAKIMAGAGAFMIVLSFALASLLPVYEPLAGAFIRTAPRFLDRVDQAQKSALLGWLWEHVAVPMLIRPAWLLPLMLGLVFVTLAVQLSWKRR